VLECISVKLFLKLKNAVPGCEAAAKFETCCYK